MKKFTVDRIRENIEKCDEQCGETARFSVGTKLGVFYFCPNCLLLLEKTLVSEFAKWFNSTR